MEIGSMMQNPQMQQMIQSRMQQQNQKPPGIEDLLKGGGGGAPDLAKQLPKLMQMQEQMKIQDAERKLKKLKLDFLVKQAESQAEQQQMQAARQSV